MTVVPWGLWGLCIENRLWTGVLLTSCVLLCERAEYSVLRSVGHGAVLQVLTSFGKVLLICSSLISFNLDASFYSSWIEMGSGKGPVWCDFCIGSSMCSAS